MIVHRYICDKCKSQIGEFKKDRALSIGVNNLKALNPLPLESFPIEDQLSYTSATLHFCDRYCLSEFLDDKIAELRQKIELAKEENALTQEEETINHE